MREASKPVKRRTKKAATKKADIAPFDLSLRFTNRETGEPFGTPIVIPATALNPRWLRAYNELMKIPLMGCDDV